MAGKYKVVMVWKSFSSKVHKMKVLELEQYKEQCKKSQDEAKILKAKVCTETYIRVSNMSWINFIFLCFYIL